ncbi:uncharacterized protein LOC127751885 [Frankliniella occidentalis]|uniref:Uncharacterized protein LOC127751885 n=1 Tax=Frankliniella occidentalis TaxID=133901 RepID=A0A9C6XUZ4_FRAOC|nr:uncharacterized protein LOC127751885 [Frankliniella occidentalis]
MPSVCCAPHCTNSSKKGFRLVNFPVESNLRDAWKNAIGRPTDWEPRRGDQLCEVHFKISDWHEGRKVLKPHVTPSLCILLKPYKTKEKKIISSASKHSKRTEKNFPAMHRPTVKNMRTVPSKQLCSVVKETEKHDRLEQFLLEERSCLERVEEGLIADQGSLQEILFLKQMDMFEEMYM